MDELEAGLKISLSGPSRERALGLCGRQLAAWNVTMPAVEPLVLDFGLGEFEKTGLIEYWIANEIEAGYCGKWLFLFAGQTCPRHHHQTKLETFFIFRGTVRMQFEGREWNMAPGEVLRVEAGKPHQFKGVGPALLLEVSKPCVVADNYFADTRIPIGGNYLPNSRK
jgi:mannose-6-phosphate isomerase-like protein (cupin superfamily)